MPQVSLVCSTKGRQKELAVLLTSLQRQIYQDFEIIVVDQNEPGFLDAVIAPFIGQMVLTHLCIQETGVSLGRNRGIPCCRGKIIGFPDDDCEYPADLLANVVQEFAHNEQLGLFCGSCRSKLDGRFAAANFVEGAALLTVDSFWNRHIAFAMFVKKEALYAVGFFDERLGVGRWFGSAEETDLLLRLLIAGVSGFYDAEIFAHHPDVGIDSSMLSARRAWRYGLGWGGFVQKHLRAGHGKLVLPAYIKSLYRSLGGCVLMLAGLHFGRARFYAYSFFGRCCGLMTPLS
jgi:glycosyltransferase involved in cell wall biosynthesis